MDFPKWQISKFHGEDRQLQSVFRTNDKDEYLEVLKEWGKNAQKTPLPATSAPSTPRPPSEFFGVCKKDTSHGNMIMGKKGKPYCVKCYIEWKDSQKVAPF